MASSTSDVFGESASVLQVISTATSAEELDCFAAAIDRRRAALEQGAKGADLARPTKRPRVSGEDFIVGANGEHIPLVDIPRLARRPVTAADVAGKATVRILLNGCFDIMHAGHYNALRQAKMLFSGMGAEVILVAGVHRTQSITRQKGPPVMSDDERAQMVASCKWVDEVAIIPEYLIDVALLDSLRLDFCAHGDDLPIRTDGTGMFHEAIAHGRFRMIQRTEGVSTTTFIGRLLAAVTPPEANPGSTRGAATGSPKHEEQIEAVQQQKIVEASATLLPTGSRISAFAGFVHGASRISSAKRIVYVDGGFDCFHVGHVAFLERARALGDCLLVGLHTDSILRAAHGPGHPIMSLHERALCVMANKHVDDTIIGVPWTVTKDLIASMHISVVVCGSAPTTVKQRLIEPQAAGVRTRGSYLLYESSP
jgi:ethanolamine-phosphate cytidylyltransferase